MEEKRLFKGILEIIGDGIIVISLDGDLLDINKTFADMLGYKKNELIGRHIMDISPHNIPGFSSEDSTPMINKLLTEGFVKNQEIKYVKKDGSVFFAEVNINSWKDHC